MKTRLILLFSILTFCTAKAQYVTIPDPTFAFWLRTYYPNCMNVNQMDTTCNDILHATGISLGNNGFYNLYGVQFFDSLLGLACPNLGLDSLPPLPPLLRTLNCPNNDLTRLPQLPAGLKTLICDRNEITNLAPLPSSLSYLNVANNQLSQLPLIPSTVTYLACGYNQLTVLPPLPAVLKKLFCEGNQLTTLPLLPDSVEIIDCSRNTLNSLPALPKLLENLNCRNNMLRHLPELSSGIVELNCDTNLLEDFPPFNPSLTELWCRNNYFSAFPPFPPSLKKIYATGNFMLEYVAPIVYKIDIFELNYTGLKYLSYMDTMGLLNLSNNEQLTCLPKIKYIQNLNTTNTPILCRQPGGNVGNSSTPAYNSYAICTSDSSACTMLWDIAGRSYFDQNLNCKYDALDHYIRNNKYTLWKQDTLISSFISDNGQFYFKTPTTGIYQVRIDTTGNAFQLACPQNGIYTDTVTTVATNTLRNDFAFKCKEGYDYLVQRVTKTDVFRPANLAAVSIVAGEASDMYNATCGTDRPGRVTITISGDAQYVAPQAEALVPTSVIGKTIEYVIPNMNNIKPATDFGITIRVDTLAQLGATICFVVKIDAVAGERDTINNVLKHCFNIINSYDPNDKQVSPVADIDTAQQWLTYTVRFQNTGTAEAQHIYIMDTLSIHVDVSSLEILDYSHRPMNVQINEHILRFNFPYINLPDSNTNEPASHGYVQYKVKLNEDLPIGTQIENTAHIYFDFNAPVVTNTTVNTITLPADTVGVGIPQIGSAIALSIYPNPANHTLTVATAQPGNMLAIFNTQGQLVMKRAMNGSAETLDIAELNGGVYYIEVSNAKGTARKKFIKL